MVKMDKDTHMGETSTGNGLMMLKNKYQNSKSGNNVKIYILK